MYRAPTLGWFGAVEAGIGIVSSLSSLFGFHEKPYNDFLEKISPILTRQVSATGMHVFCLWFGEVMGYNPSGDIVSLGRISPSAEGNPSLAAAEAESIIKMAVEEAGVPAYFYKNGEFILVSPGEQAGRAGGGINPLLLIGGGLFLLKRFL